MCSDTIDEYIWYQYILSNDRALVVLLFFDFDTYIQRCAIDVQRLDLLCYRSIVSRCQSFLRSVIDCDANATNVDFVSPTNNAPLIIIVIHFNSTASPDNGSYIRDMHCTVPLHWYSYENCMIFVIFLYVCSPNPTQAHTHAHTRNCICDTLHGQRVIPSIR